MHPWPCIERSVLLNGSDDVFPLGRDSHLRGIFNGFRLQHPTLLPGIGGFGISTDNAGIHSQLDEVMRVATVGGHAAYQHEYLRTAC